MSPEQASADRDVSPRSDVYSLGCVLYEMLTGDPPHTGPTSHVILMRILTEAPRSVTEVRNSVPVHVGSAVSRALEKLPADRFDSAEAFRGALGDEGFRHSPPTGLQPGPMTDPAEGDGLMPLGALVRDLRFVAVALLAVVALAFSAWAASDYRSEREDEAVVKAATPLPLGFGTLLGNRVTISPTGDRIAWFEEREAGQHLLLIRPLSGLETVEVPGSRNARSPFFSPDGAWLAFISSSGDLVRVSVNGGQPLTLARDVNLLDAHWGDTGEIIGAGQEGLYTIPDVGGRPELRVKDPLGRWPELLPGGHAVVYTHGLSSGGSEIYLADLETGEFRPLLPEGTNPHYVESGHLVYGELGQTLFAVSFDLKSLTLSGSPVPVLDEVRVHLDGGVQFAVARNGVAVYIPMVSSFARRELVEVSPDGQEEVLPIEAGDVWDPRYAPDGQRIAYRYEEKIYVFSFLTGSRVLVSGDFSARFPVWSKDGSMLTFAGLGAGTDDFDGMRAPADGSAPPELLYTKPFTNVVEGWLSDGRALVRETPLDRGRDLLIYRFNGDSVVETPYLTAEWQERGASISPDGDWVAYLSNESGQQEVYVRAFPQPSERIPISRDGGSDPRWSPDGRTLYYREGSALVAVDLGPGPDIEARGWNVLFPGVNQLRFANFAQYDVHPLEDRFLIVRDVVTETSEPEDFQIVLVVNWFQELVERMRSGGIDEG
jgi:serine/threonine-protein kinase